MWMFKAKVAGISTIGGLICALVLVFSGLSIAQDSDFQHECVMMGILPSASGSLPDGIFTNTLMSDSQSIQYGNQSNGWGMGWYVNFGDTPVYNRSAEKPSVDGAYTDVCSGVTVPAGEYARTAAYLDTLKPKVLVTHWRTGSSGCGGYVADAHPFYREYDGKTWSFVQNGGQNKYKARRLIIDGNPDPVNNDWMNDLPNSSGVLGCYPQEVCKYHNTHVEGDIEYMIDSELYFLLIMKEIKRAHAAGGTTLQGIAKAVARIINNGETGGINFIFTDGYSMWGFKRGNILSYRYDPTYHFTHIATMQLTGLDANKNSTGFDNSGWVSMVDYQIVVAEQGAAPVLYDIRNLIPGNLDGDTYVDEKDKTIVLNAVGTCQGDANYNQKADLDGDNCVTQADDLALWNKYYTQFTGTILCDDHSDWATRCCRDFKYCGGTYLTLDSAATTEAIDAGADYDYYKFYAVQDKVYTIKVGSTPLPSTTTYLYLYNANLSQLTSTSSKQIIWTCPSSGLYYVRVHYSSVSSSGPYTLTLSVPNVKNVQIDVQPGSYPNYIPSNGLGTIPVAILSSPSFDATQVDLSTLALSGLPVSQVGGTPQFQIQDVNGDGTNDLVVQFQNQSNALRLDTAKVELIGKMNDGTLIEGTDSVIITSGLTAMMASKSGPQNARVWTIAVSNTGPQTAYSSKIDGFKLTQTSGAACTPVIATPLPLSLGDIPAGGSANGAITINFTGCPSTARFSLKASFSADNGLGTGTIVRNNEFR